MASGGKLSVVTGFLDRLDEAGIHYTLSSVEEGTVTVGVTVPGEHWEVAFAADGEVEVEVFRSDGEVHALDAVEQLFERGSDD